jgi:hypothetical protein
MTVFVALCLVGCSDDSEVQPKDSGQDTTTPEDLGTTPPPDKLDCNNDCKDFVMTELALPPSGTTVGLDFDGDGNVDNALGTILSSLTEMGLDVQESFKRGVLHGDIVVLMRLQAADFNNTDKAGAQLWMGESTSCCVEKAPDKLDQCRAEAEAKDGCFGGSYTFYPDPKSDKDALLGGKIIEKQLRLGPGKMTLVLPVAIGTDLVLNLEHVFVRGQVDPGGNTVTNGLLAGVVSKSDLEQSFVPGIKAVLDDTLADPNTDQKEKDLLLKLFDKDNDGAISLEEVKQNSLIQTILAGDIDLNKDGVKELSLGLTFEAVGAKIDDTGAPPDAGPPDAAVDAGADTGADSAAADAGPG